MKTDFCGLEYIADTDNYVVFDIETTGLEGSEIIDFAALKVRDGQICGAYRTYVKPSGGIPDSVSRINGITDEMVENAPSFSEVADDIIEFFGDDIIVGHCLEKFALRILCEELERVGCEDIQNDYIDLMAISEECYGGEIKNYRLKSIAEFLEVKIEGSTGAFCDCRIINECYKKAACCFRNMWTRTNIYSELCGEFNELVHRIKRKKNVGELHTAIDSLYGGKLKDPIMRCSAYLPLIKYELYINRFEKELTGELYGLRRDYERGLYRRMSIKDIEKVKFDIDYCIEKLEKPKKRWFLF